MMLRKKGTSFLRFVAPLILFFMLSPYDAKASDDMNGAITPGERQLLGLLNNHLKNAAGRISIQKMPRQKDQAEVFKKMLQALAVHNLEAARQSAQIIDYKLSSIKTDHGEALVGSDMRRPAIHPFIAVNTKPKIDLIFTAPHALYEKGTADQAIFVLSKAGAKALVISAAHRCASIEASVCSGRTKVCGGGKRAYRSSDVAHNTHTYFHLAHEVFAKTSPNALFVSSHGMRADKKGVKTSIILSDGFRKIYNTKNTPVSTLREKLQNIYIGDGRVASCNHRADLKYKFRKLCGTTNVQGRLLNDVKNPCTNMAKNSSHRFIHIEQDMSVRRGFLLKTHTQNLGAAPIGFLQSFYDISPKL